MYNYKYTVSISSIKPINISVLKKCRKMSVKCPNFTTCFHGNLVDQSNCNDLKIFSRPTSFLQKFFWKKAVEGDSRTELRQQTEVRIYKWLVAIPFR